MVKRTIFARFTLFFNAILIPNSRYKEIFFTFCLRTEFALIYD